MIYQDYHASWIGFCQRLLLVTKFQSPQDAFYSYYLYNVFVVVGRIIAVDGLGRERKPYEEMIFVVPVQGDVSPHLIAYFMYVASIAEIAMAPTS